MASIRTLTMGAAVAILTVCALAGCTTPAEPGAGATAQSFLEALQQRDAETAISLSTSSPDDFTCVSRPGIGVAEVGTVEEDGNSATAEVEYSIAGEPIAETLDLERIGGDWKVVLPESYRIVVTEPDVVVEATFDDDCTVQAVDGVIELPVLPGSHSLILRDPTGVFSSGSLGFVTVPGDGTIEYLEGDETFIKPIEREIVANLLATGINEAVYQCIESGFVDSSCPEGIPAGDESQVRDRPFELVSADPRAVTIFSTDGETWRFETDTQSFSIQVNGIIVPTPFSYSGAVSLDEKGNPVRVFD